MTSKLHRPLAAAAAAAVLGLLGVGVSAPSATAAPADRPTSAGPSSGALLEAGPAGAEPDGASATPADACAVLPESEFTEDGDGWTCDFGWSDDEDLSNRFALRDVCLADATYYVEDVDEEGGDIVSIRGECRY